MKFHLATLFFSSLISLAMSNTQVPLANPNFNEAPLTTDQPSLADLLTLESGASIFFSYARETSMSALFSEERARTTVFVPTNKAVMALSRKPHQGPASQSEPDVDISEQELDRRTQQNVANWVGAHIVPHSPLHFSPSQHYSTLMEGKIIHIAVPEKKTTEVTEPWKRAVIDGDIHIIDKKEASNGVMYLVDNTVKVD